MPVAEGAIRGWQKAGFLNGRVDAVLEKFIEPGAFGLDLSEVGDFRPQRDAELMAAVLGQPKLLGVIGFHDDGHSIVLSMF
jgi:hypothetical protein